MIFKSPGDTQGHGESSEISDFLAGKISNAFCSELRAPSPEFKLSFFALFIKTVTKNFSNYL